MLALSRKSNESIMIGNDIEITILDIKNDQVKIGITAPKSVGIYRKEIYLQIQEENKKAISGNLDILKQFYTVPFIHNIPLSVFVVIFAMVLIKFN